MGDDLLVVNAARVSFHKESAWENEWWEDNESHTKRLPEQDKKLIKYLAKHNHWTPFSHPQITMREKVPIFVARQRFKHMVGFTYNEVSRRYVDDSPEFFYPDFWRGRPEGNIKQGSNEDVEIEYIEFLSSQTGKIERSKLWRVYDELITTVDSLYSEMIRIGVAPEQARMVLPQSMYTEYYSTGSLAAYARATNLRKDSHAQLEIQELAKQWDMIIRPLFPVSWDALVGEKWY
jgi:thymidylate synthase (FAD)